LRSAPVIAIAGLGSGLRVFSCAEPIAVRSAILAKPSRKITRKMPTLEEDLLITAATESDSDALPLSGVRMDAVLKDYVRTQFFGDPQGVYRQHPEGGGEQHGLWKSNRPIALIQGLPPEKNGNRHQSLIPAVVKTPFSWVPVHVYMVTQPLPY